MLPTFPEFKKVEITDQQDIEAFTKDYPPYSDFNFISLFCWDVDGKRRISMLNGNLVVRSTCDVTGKEFLSFLGANKVPETINELFQYAKQEGLKQELRMIPEETIKFCSDPTLSLEIKEDRDNFDYVYQMNDLCHYAGSKYSQIRYKRKRFLRDNGHSYYLKEFEIGNRGDKNHITRLFQEWCGVKEVYSEREAVALYRLISNASSFSLVNIMIFVGNNPVGFSINKIVGGGCAMNYFAKASYSYRGANPLLMQETAKCLSMKSCESFNFEEDMGLPGLRRSKESYHPAFFLRKYTIRRRGLFKKIFNVI